MRYWQKSPAIWHSPKPRDTGDNGLWGDTVSGTTLTVSAIRPDTPCVGSFYVTADDGQTAFSQRFGIAVTSGTTGIHTLRSDAAAPASTAAYYNLAGQRVVKPARGIYIQNGRKVVVR